MNTRQLRRAIYDHFAVTSPRQLRKICKFSKDFDLRCKGHLLNLAQMAGITTTEDPDLQDDYFEWQAGLTAACDMFSNPVQPSIAA